MNKSAILRGGPLVRRTTVPPAATVGTGGAQVFGGFLFTGEADRRLVGLEKYKTYSDILANVSIVAAGVRFFLNLVAKAEWKVEPSDHEDDQAVKYAEAVEKIFRELDTPWHRVVRRSAMYRFHGFAIQEHTAELRKDGVIGFKDIAPRPQRSITQWDVDDFGKVQGMVQTNPNTFKEIYLPAIKVVYMVDDSLNDDPEGLGLFRHVVEPARRLQRFETLEGFGMETDLRGIPVARVPAALLQDMVNSGAINEAQRTQLLAPLTNFLKNHVKNPELGLLLDSTPYRGLDEAGTPSRIRKWDIDILKGEGAGAGLKEIAVAIERLNREIARILGVEQLLLGAGDRGSFAMAESKSESFLLIINSTLQELAVTYERDLLRPMWDWNGWDTDKIPTFKIEPVQYRDVSQIAASLKDLAAAGVILSPDDPAVLEMFDMMGLSRPTKTLQDLFGDASLDEARSISRDISSGRARGRERRKDTTGDDGETE